MNDWRTTISLGGDVPKICGHRVEEEYYNKFMPFYLYIHFQTVQKSKNRLNTIYQPSTCFLPRNIMICDPYQKVIPEVGKHESELREKTGFRVEFVKIEVMIDSCRKQYGEYEKTSLRLWE